MLGEPEFFDLKSWKGGGIWGNSSSLHIGGGRFGKNLLGEPGPGEKGSGGVLDQPFFRREGLKKRKKGFSPKILG